MQKINTTGAQQEEAAHIHAYTVRIVPHGGDCPDAELLLAATNRYRAVHQAPPLTWDEGLAAESQAYAVQLASKQCVLTHGDVGENLFGLLSYPWPDGRCLEAVDGWYGEVKSYNFSAEFPFFDNFFRAEVGHFTQLVWKASTAVGCGFAVVAQPIPFTSGNVYTGGCKVVVCRYNPPGNYADDGLMAQNVLPNITAIPPHTRSLLHDQHEQKHYW
ncbi:hypothetical protein PLESTB_001627900 [Pleodorina starrii]|uniref:SCP domain-containing protein n=1 Tax=Pleodorina starrii TaxID=330485 RepID=A0A9W6F9B6_9CHLO|nr:hypothetical protein PLESTB_001627900 [Pleodorina starrii]